MKTSSSRHQPAEVKAASVLIFRILFFLLLPILTIFFLSSPATGFAWDFANLFGYVGMGLFLILLLHSAAPRIFPTNNRKFYIYLHRDLAFLALFFISGHIVILLIKQPLLIEHLKLTAPLYMLSGLLAVILIILLISSSLTSVRNQLFTKFQQFRQFHIWLSVIIIALMTYHLIESDYYLSGLVKQILFIALVMAVIFIIFYKLNPTVITNDQIIELDRKASMTINILLLLLFILLCLITALIKQAL